MHTDNFQQGMINLCFFSTLALVFMKCFNMITWSWWLVLTPIWIALLIIILCLVFNGD